MTSEALSSPAGKGLGLPWGPPLSPPTPRAHSSPSLSCTHSCVSQAFVVQFLFVCWARGQQHLPPSLCTPHPKPFTVLRKGCCSLATPPPEAQTHSLQPPPQAHSSVCCLRSLPLSKDEKKRHGKNFLTHSTNEGLATLCSRQRTSIKYFNKGQQTSGKMVNR